MLERAQESVRFYSVSCCFGFYSYGLKNFEKVLLSFKSALQRRFRGRYLDFETIVKVDPDNPIDIYAAVRLADLEKRFARTGSDGYRQIFKKVIGTGTIDTQFMIIDGRHVLVSGAQSEVYNDDLDLVLNISQPGYKFEKDENSSKFSELDNLFNKAWIESVPLDVQVPEVSRRKLRFILENLKGIKTTKSEREFQILLYGALQVHFIPAIVDFEVPNLSTRIDLLVGQGPTPKRHGLELKYKPDDSAINGIIGQIEGYRDQYEDVYLVVAFPEYSPSNRMRLLQKFNEMKVTLIELK